MAKKKKQKNVAAPQASEQGANIPSTKQVDSSVKPLSWIMLAVISFLCGYLVMVIELTSSRLLAPFYGNTIYCWTGVIGTILFTLSLGYFIGGLLADKYPERRLLQILLGLSCITVAVIPFVGKLFLTKFLSHQSIVWGPIWGTLVVFLFPTLFLSTIPPLCVKGLSQHFKVVGLASGLVSSISALGSIIGTFMTGFYLIPTYNLSVIYFISAAILLLLVLLVSMKEPVINIRNVSLVVVMLFFAGSFGYGISTNDDPYNLFPHTGEVYQKMTPYNLIRVYDENTYYRLKLDSTDEGAMSKEGYNLVFNYTKYWELVKCFLSKQEMQKVCFIGGGAFAMPTVFSRDIPDAQVDVIEIDQALVPVAEKYFKLEQKKNLRIHIEDGRRWFRDKENCYDFIFLDAFRGPQNIPFHLVTTEYFQELHRSLTNRGVLAMNVISARSGKHSLFYRCLLKSLRKNFNKIFVFSTHKFLDTVSSNLIIFCLKDETSYNVEKLTERAKLQNLTQFSQNMVESLGKNDMPQDSEFSELTDEYNPVEYIILDIE